MNLWTTRVCVRTMGKPARRVSVHGVLTTRSRRKGSVVIPRTVRPTPRTTTDDQIIGSIRVAATATGLRRVFADPLAVDLVAHLPLMSLVRVMELVAEVRDLPPGGLPIGRINHRLRPLIRVMELAAEDNPPGLRSAVASDLKSRLLHMLEVD